MKKMLLMVLLLSIIQIYSCDEGLVIFLNADQFGICQDYFTVPANGKFKITEVDRQCYEIQSKGIIYKTHYKFVLNEAVVVLDCDCNRFEPGDYYKVEKGDKIKLILQYAERYTRYRVKYDFIEDKK
jgi:hypothetical protein